MIPEFSFSEKREENLAFYIETTGNRAQSLKPVLENVMDKILERNRRSYETRGATTGVYWAPLRGTTVKRKIAEGSKTPMDPLRRFGALEKSLSQRGAPEQILDVTDDHLLLATTLQYAAYHVTGTGRMPARPPLTIPAKHAAEYTEDIKDYIFDVFGDGE